MEYDITPIIAGIVGLLGAVISVFVIPYIKSKTTREQWELIKAWTKTAVRAAEIIYEGAGQGILKRQYVMNYIKKLCEENNIKISTAMLRNALEEAVKQMQEEEEWIAQ